MNIRIFYDKRSSKNLFLENIVYFLCNLEEEQVRTNMGVAETLNPPDLYILFIWEPVFFN